MSFLIDIDGTLYDGETVIPGGPETLAELQARRSPFLLVTNTTRMAKSEILSRLLRLGYQVDPEQVFPVPNAAIQYVLSLKPAPRCYLVAAEPIVREFQDAGIEVVQSEQPVDFVIFSQYLWISMQQIDIAYRLVKQGAEPVAMHRDMTYPENGVLRVGLGPVVAALEAVTQVPVTIIGKPNPRFFELALSTAGFEKANTVMVGDNYDGDICGAIDAGLRAVLVQTGAYDPELVRRGPHTPTWTLPSIAELPSLLEQSRKVGITRPPCLGP